MLNIKRGAQQSQDIFHYSGAMEFGPEKWTSSRYIQPQYVCFPGCAEEMYVVFHQKKKAMTCSNSVIK